MLKIPGRAYEFGSSGLKRTIFASWTKTNCWNETEEKDQKLSIQFINQFDVKKKKRRQILMWGTDCKIWTRLDSTETILATIKHQYLSWITASNITQRRDSEHLPIVAIEQCTMENGIIRVGWHCCQVNCATEVIIN